MKLAHKIDNIEIIHPLVISMDWEECIYAIRKLEKAAEIYEIPLNEEAETELGRIYYQIGIHAEWARRLFRSFGYKGLTRKTAGRVKQFVRNHPSYGWHR
tara:strand:- start:40 stop:339 length:300 start_codon:yes stop_codon:yes gene_type:complete